MDRKRVKEMERSPKTSDHKKPEEKGRSSPLDLNLDLDLDSYEN